jgi:hypothetical protein
MMGQSGMQGARQKVKVVRSMITDEDAKGDISKQSERVP